MMDEYLSFPTNTLYTIDEVDKVPAPAFTICPRPSVKAFPSLPQTPTFQEFMDSSLSLKDVVSDILGNNPFWNYSTVNNESIIEISDSKFPHWVQTWKLQRYKCIILYFMQEVGIGENGNFMVIISGIEWSITNALPCYWKKRYRLDQEIASDNTFNFISNSSSNPGKKSRRLCSYMFLLENIDLIQNGIIYSHAFVSLTDLYRSRFSYTIRGKNSLFWTCLSPSKWLLPATPS